MNKLPKDQPPKNDAPVTDPQGNPQLNISKGKVKKNKKKKHPNRNESASSSSMSEPDSVTPLMLNEAIKEQFYDAHESYHGIPENDLLAPPGSTPAPQVPAAPVTTLATDPTLLLVRSAHSQEPKLLEQLPSDTHGSAGRPKKASSTVTKPVTGPD